MPWPLNRSAGSRTSPDGPRDEGCFLFCWGRLGTFHRRRQIVAEKRFIYPFNRATAEAGQEARCRSDAKGHWFSGCPVLKPDTGRLDNSGIQPEGGWRAFGCFSRGRKVPRRRQTALRAAARLFGGTAPKRSYSSWKDSGLISILYPVSRAARRAFWPFPTGPGPAGAPL